MLPIIRDRSSGKTKELFYRACKDPKAIIICARPERMAQKAIIYGIPGLKFCSYDEMADAYKEGYNLYVDELKACIQHLTGTEIYDFTLSLEENGDD